MYYLIPISSPKLSQYAVTFLKMGKKKFRLPWGLRKGSDFRRRSIKCPVNRASKNGRKCCCCPAKKSGEYLKTRIYSTKHLNLHKIL